MTKTDRNAVRVVVAGDRGTGKSSLIAAIASESFPDTVLPVLPPTLLPADYFPDHVPITVIDTSSSLEKQNKRNEELKGADVVVLTYACNDSQSFSRLSSYWFRELQKLEVTVPIIVVGCKLDLRDESQQVSLERLMAQLLQEFKNVATCIECSAATLYQVPEVFYFAQKAVLHPVEPLFDHESQALTDKCVRALRRIFVLCDRDMDDALNDAELSDFQVRCFNAPLELPQIADVKTVVQQDVPEGINSHGLTFPGFLYIHNMFLRKGNPETFWAVLRYFGYDNDLKLKDNFLPVPSKTAPDQSVELTGEAVEFLNGIFRLLDTDKDRALKPSEVDKLFCTAPESPWNDAPYNNVTERTDMDYMSLNGFLSQWALMTLLDPPCTLANLIYIGYSGNPAAALRVTRRRSVDRKKQTTERNVFQCYVFGSKNAGKSALLDALLGRPFSNNYTPTTVEKFAANAIELIGGTRKTLVLREIPESEVSKFLSNQDYLAACDVAIFVYDSSDEYSWKKSRDLLEKVAGQGDLTGYRVPCLLIAAKDDLTPYPRAVQDSVKVTLELGIEAPIHVSMKLGDSNNVYNKIVSAAEHPHLSIPETEIGKKRKQYNRLVQNSLIFASVGTAMAVVGLAACRAYAVKKNSSA
ncbi:putative small GTPase superfamily, EF-hand domain pair [Medicago truncatula]|uniref:Mitochondrial Rho GTPase n=1 Tax=Medicago truncatula TaxID=3880 RepID=A0A072UD33_MEDTR|nr:mitochondrial Rho GTPase 2 isoform X2 [Medicago truncatula]KEH23750.1 Rho GTPase [Medicago truncatula]RHN48068.1 putative small GTPase superfamily, EF-hand domain pair [Medicago truncatula]